MKKPIILDVDTGIDDAMAIIFALNSKKCDIQFICSCQGNTNAKQGAINTLNILNLIDAPGIPVLVGSEKGFKKTRNAPSKAHGQNGLGGYVFPKNKRKICKKNYLKYYINFLQKIDKPISIVVLGPLTNLANVLEKCPKCAEKIEQIIFMGSSLDKPVGKKPYAPFNIACDPEALQKVLDSKVKIVFCPNNLGRDCYFTLEEVNKIKNKNQVGFVISEICKGYHDHFIKKGVSVYDSASMFTYLFPKYAYIKNANVELKYFPAINTALALHNFRKKANCQVATKLDVKKFKSEMMKAIKEFNK